MKVFVAASTLLLLVTSLLTAAAQPTPTEQLGKQLFFDAISAPSQSQSCSSCHVPETGWTSPNAGANIHGAVLRGAHPGRFGNRKPPSIAYAAFSPTFNYDEATGQFVGGAFWDGRATGDRNGSPVADQALGPFLNRVEQNASTMTEVCQHVAASPYRTLFEQAWGAGSLDCSSGGVTATFERIGKSIASYEGSSEVVPFSSRFDDYWRACLAAGQEPEDCGKAEGDKTVLDPQNILTTKEFAGLIEFGEYCSSCHVSHEAGPNGTPPLFTSFHFQNVGVPANPENPFYDMDKVLLEDGTPVNPLGRNFVDYGLGDVLRNQPTWAHLALANEGKFKIPTLRNVDARRGNGFPKAYMHNGVFKRLADVVHFYNTRDVPAAGWPAPEVSHNVNRDLLGEDSVPLGNLQLDAAKEASIVAFLGTLTDRTAPGEPIKVNGGPR